jgi:hypothetical protein
MNAAALGGEGPVGVRQQRQHRGLVRDEGAHVPGVGGHQGEGAHRSAAVGEHLHRAADRLDDAVQIVGVLLGRVLGPAVVPGAAAQAPGVVGDHGAVREV